MFWNWTEFTRANRIVYAEEGDSVTLFCNINPFSIIAEWYGRRVNEDSFRKYSEGVSINPGLPNAFKLKISLGKYDLQISNVSVNEEGLYRCLSYTKSTSIIENIELKIIGI